jgi:hypothetical protein
VRACLVERDGLAAPLPSSFSVPAGALRDRGADIAVACPAELVERR